MERRFYCEVPEDAREVSLRGDEAQHLARVLRARAGEEVILFDGRGGEYTAEILRVGRNEVALAITLRAAVDRELRHPVHVAAALPKGERQRWLIEKAVELGVTTLTPLATERAVAQPTASALERLRRYVVEASKQCGRNRLMEIAEPQHLAQFAAAAPREATRLLAHPPEAPSAQSSLFDLFRPNPVGLYVLAGPEGGFTATELAVAEAHGWQAVSLGPRILRIETAVLVLAALAANGQPPARTAR